MTMLRKMAYWGIGIICIVGQYQANAQIQISSPETVEYQIPFSSLEPLKDSFDTLKINDREKHLSREIDGFAGFYLDKVPGTFVVIMSNRVAESLLNRIRRDKIAQIIREVYKLDFTEKFDLGKRQFIYIMPDQKIIVIKVKKYDYKQLLYYRSLVEQNISRNTIGSLGIDVEKNVISVFGQDGIDLKALYLSLVRIGIPIDAFNIRGTAVTTIN